VTTTDNDQRREAIRRTLAQRAGDTPDTSAVAEALLSTWHQMATRLAPVIGTRGVDAILRRSLHLTSNSFPWLATAEEHADSTAPLISFRACLDASEPAAAAEASYALLVTFTELLATLIGESLTDRLLGPVLAPPPTMSDQEISP
jgi:hypothetical protein